MLSCSDNSIVRIQQCYLFHSLGSLLNVMYTNLNAGNYILRIVANADAGQRDVIRRVIRIGKCCYCLAGNFRMVQTFMFLFLLACWLI